MIVKPVQCIGVLATCLILLSGCKSISTKPPEVLSCAVKTETACTVPVSVKCINNSCKISSPAKTDVVEARGNNVFWVLQDDDDSKRFTFDPDKGIETKEGSGLRCQPVGTRSFKCLNANKVGYHHYTINLVGDVVVPPLDPWVVNYRN
jgi:hypothetical protein